MNHFAAAALMGCLATAASADMARYELDPEHTAVYFTVGHLGYADVLGIFTEVQGGFMFDADTQDLGDVTVTITAASVNTFNDARNGHVRNADFLDVNTHPEITFVATGGSATSDTTGTVEGQLTILGQTLPVTLDVTLNKSGPYPFGHGREVLGLSMSTQVKRSDFGMTYGVDGGLVGDEVTINIETEAMLME